VSDGWLALRGSSIESFLFRMGPAVNRDNPEVMLSNFALCASECESQLHYVVCSG